MPIKPRYKRRTFWTIVIIASLFIIGLLVVPTMINLNHARERIQTAIFEQTGVPVKINGDINFGILGHTTVVAHDVKTPNGKIRTVTVKIPFSGLFNFSHARLDGEISIRGANINLVSMAALGLQYNINITDCTLRFLDKDYNIVTGKYNHGKFSGIVRTGTHKYDIVFDGQKFSIKNKNLNLDIAGVLYPNGTASGTLDIDTDKINSWFEFSEPKISRRVNLHMDFTWDGGYGFKFTNLIANNVRGEIELFPDGWRKIKLHSNNTAFDFSFLTHPTRILKNTTLDIDFYGGLIFEKHELNHVKIDAIATENYIQIHNIIADNLSITGGTINHDGANNIRIKTTIDDTDISCTFTGTPQKWQCSDFIYGNITGKISKHKNGTIYANITSQTALSGDELNQLVRRFGIKNAEIEFKFSDIGGKYIIEPDGTRVQYNYIYGKNLRWLNPTIKILPEFMMTEPGNMIWTNRTMVFTPTNQQWSLTLQNNLFHLIGTNIKKAFPNTDLPTLNNSCYSVSGFYNDRGDISELTIKIGNHVFTGTATPEDITIHTDALILDTFLNQEFFARYSEMEFFTNAPILLPFGLNRNVYLTADKLIYNQNEYNNFVYSLKSGTQTFSISDTARGNMLITIIQERAMYDIFIQMNNFVINGELFRNTFPINLRNTKITAEMQLHTHGHIAHDIWYNLSGDMDITLDGGYIIGLGLDNFYANADELTRLNIQDNIIMALESGATRLKNMRIIGKYENGNFATTTPLEFSVHHATGRAELTVTNGALSIRGNINLRGVAPDMVTIPLSISPTGRRMYSLSEIMRYFDPIYMRTFIKTHKKF